MAYHTLFPQMTKTECSMGLLRGCDITFKWDVIVISREMSSAITIIIKPLH